MPRSVRVAVGIGSLFVAAALSVACGSDSHPSAFTPAGSAGASAATGLGTGGASSLNTGSNGGSGNSGTLSDACAAQVSTAEPVPLDMYIMLDVSSSMLDVTTGTVTKWDAVKSALSSFLNDSASAGLGVGLQYFPLPKVPAAPASCEADADCGGSGPCFSKLCFKAAATELVACETESDCVDPTTGKDEGPCTLTADCSNDTDYICQNPGGNCGTTDTMENLGKCTVVPGQCEQTSNCDVSVYETPAAAIATLPDAATGLLASINAKTPDGGTPTAPALTGAIQQASAWATAHPDHRVITVMATDGLPTDCTPIDIDSVAAIAANGVSDTPSINTFVIGVFGPDDVAAGAPANLNEIAQKGGTTSAFIVDTTQDVTTQFLNALDTIRGARLACQFQIPQPMADQTLDFSRVNVQFTNDGKTSVVYYVGSASACDGTTGGWYYDVDPSAGTPTKIIACPTSCSTFQAGTDGASVGVALGCTTVVK